MKIEVEYDDGKSDDEEWDLHKDVYCSNCGKLGSVWSGPDRGDYHFGCQHVCLACESTGWHPLMFKADWKYDLQRIDKLKSALKGLKR